jgi:hypothetical protein
VAGDRVLVTLDVGLDDDADPANDTRTAWLARFDLGMQPIDQIQLADDTAHSGYADLAVDDDGTAYAALVVGTLGTDDVEVRLVEVRADANAPRTVATFPGFDLVDAVAVDPAGEFVYVGGLDNAGESRLTVTPVARDGGDEPEPVVVCESVAVDALAVTPDGDSLLLASSCRDRDPHSNLFTLR